VYPQELEHTVTLFDGTSVRVRPIRPDDESRLRDLYGRLSADSVYQRFFSPMKSLPTPWARWLANVDYHERLALVAERDHGRTRAPALIGVARYTRGPMNPALAEIALVVEDGWQGKGLGTILLVDVLAAGEARDIEQFRADVLTGNARMLRLLARHARISRQRQDHGVVEVVFERSRVVENAS
jgi:GNAT superfamily N-acetyltransferase